ncbi:unnamed protein product, partial [Hymenolepis diminuta]
FLRRKTYRGFFLAKWRYKHSEQRIISKLYSKLGGLTLTGQKSGSPRGLI